MKRTGIPAWSAVALAIIALAVSACSHGGSAGTGLLPYAAPQRRPNCAIAALIVGTSWSRPTAVALLTEAVQICGPLGWVNPAIYSVYKAHGEAPNFIDVTSGSNAGFMGESTGYSAKAGYDNVSGIGMPNGITFAKALCPGR